MAVSSCNGWNVLCPPPNLYVEILTPQCDGDEAFGNWPSCKDEALKNDRSVLIEETVGGSLDTSAIGAQRKKPTVCDPWSKPPPDTETASILILNFPTSRPVRNKYLLFSHLVYDVFVWQPE